MKLSVTIERLDSGEYQAWLHSGKRRFMVGTPLEIELAMWFANQLRAAVGIIPQEDEK